MGVRDGQDTRAKAKAKIKLRKVEKAQGILGIFGMFMKEKAKGKSSLKQHI